MSWKNWPGWLKGGVIFLIIGLVLFFVGIGLIYLDLSINRCSGECVMKSSILSSIGGLFFAIFSWPMMLIHNQDYLILGFILSILQLFIIGALIGWIVGKIRKK